MAKAKKIQFKISPQTIKILKVLFTLVILLFALDAAIQFYVKQTVVAESPQGYVVKKSDIVNRFLRTKLPTTPQVLIEYELSKQIITREAKKQGINATKAEIEQELEQLKKNYGGEQVFLRSIQAQGLTLEDLKQLIKMKLTLEKIVEKDYKEPSQKELEEFFNQELKDSPEFKGKKFKDVVNKVKETYKKVKINELEKAWLDSKMSEVSSSLKNYLEEPYKYWPGKGLARLPVIREIVRAIEKKTKEQKKQAQSQTQKPTPTPTEKKPAKATPTKEKAESKKK